MAWTEITRAHYRRESLRYASDLTDAEWRLLARHLPPPCRTGRRRVVDLREIMNAILFVLRCGCTWRALPKDFPPRSTIQYYFYGWRDRQLWRRINRVLVKRVRRAAGRTAFPSAGIIDSQSVKTTEAGGPRGFDSAKRIKGRKRHLVTDTAGSPLVLQVRPANIQDHPAAVPLLTVVGHSLPKLRHIFADRVYRGEKLLEALAGTGNWTIEIVTRSQSVGTFRAEPKRWVIERTFAWLGRNRRLAKDFEASIESAEAWCYLASVQLLTRRLARPLN